jgi:hypothetical protein
MLHPSGVYTLVVGYRFTKVKILPHCTEVENGVGEEMTHLFGAIMKACTLAGIKFKLAKFVDYSPPFQVECS